VQSAKDKFSETLRTSAEGGPVDDELHGYSCRVTAAACTQTQARIFSFVCVCVCAVAKRAPCQNSIRGREKSGRDSYSDDIRLMIPVSDSVLPPLNTAHCPLP
jgi:hypothetical protein